MAVILNTRRGGGNAGTTFPVASNEANEQLVAQGMPPYTDLARSNSGWSSMAVLAVAQLVVRPTVTAAFEIWNGYTDRSLIVADIFTFNLVSSAVVESFSLWAQVTAPKAAPSAGANVTINGMNGRPYGGAVVCGLGTTVIANGWRPYGTSPPIALGAATPGGALCAPIDGRLIVPPGCSLCLHTVGSTTAWTFQNGGSWFEKVITVEG